MARRVAGEMTAEGFDPGFGFPARLFPKLTKLTTPRNQPRSAH
jgi:hypothetical protein